MTNIILGYLILVKWICFGLVGLFCFLMVVLLCVGAFIELTSRRSCNGDRIG